MCVCMRACVCVCVCVRACVCARVHSIPHDHQLRSCAIFSVHHDPSWDLGREIVSVFVPLTG